MGENFQPSILVVFCLYGLEGIFFRSKLFEIPESIREFWRAVAGEGPLKIFTVCVFHRFGGNYLDFDGFLWDVMKTMDFRGFSIKFHIFMGNKN